MPRAKKAPAAKSSKINKSAWIREQPGSMSAKEVVDKAAKAGIKLSVAQVYTTRSEAKKRGAKRGRPKGSGKGSAKAAPMRSGAAGDDELAFRRLVLSVGLPKAEAYLSELRRTVGL
jgi:hypothetical protein